MCADRLSGILVVMWQITQLNRQPGVPQLLRYSDFLDLVEKGNIEKVTFSADGQKLVATDTDGQRWEDTPWT
jgi:hypothetical protein